MFDYTPPDDWGYNCECASCDSYDYGCDDFQCGCESCEDTVMEEANKTLDVLYDSIYKVEMSLLLHDLAEVYEVLERKLSADYPVYNFYKFNTEKGRFEHK